MMVYDYALWKNDWSFVRERMRGVRGVLEEFHALRAAASGLLETLPGWPFTDWVDGWSHGDSPDGVKGPCAINNLFYVQALRAAAKLEAALGETALANRDEAEAYELSSLIVAKFWVEEHHLFADTLAHDKYSEHAQTLALLNDVLPADKQQACFNALITTKQQSSATAAVTLARTTIYFSFYLLETFYKYGRGDLIVGRLNFWKQLVDLGLKTPIESPEPARSDCHAWSSHPLYHLHASVCGIRPAPFTTSSAGSFSSAIIRPAPGDLHFLNCTQPHANGDIEMELSINADGSCSGFVQMPPRLGGQFIWGNRTLSLAAGTKTTINL